ncbi:MAG: hypothetical protein K2L05_06440 [Muribaculaceae bacterium]|nr:hypothetical protein [Muribaculaceae bacterium]
MAGFEFSVARRLGWKAEGRRRVSPAVGVAVTGVALSVVVMLISIAVMLGFKREVTNRILGADDAVTIIGYGEASEPVAFNPAEVLSAIELPEGAEITGHTSIPAILKTPDDFLGLELQSTQAPQVADTSLVLSAGSAAQLKLERGDRVPAYFFINDRLRVRMLSVDSIYRSGFGEHDLAVGYCSPRLIEQLRGIGPGSIYSLGISNITEEEIEPLASAIYSQLLRAHYAGELTAAYGISTILQTDGNLFSWLRLLDTNVIVILILMGLVAAFTLVSSLFIIILERVRTIGLLKALGASDAQIRRIFMLMAERLVLRGLAIGNLLALLLIGLQAWTHVLPLDPVNYYVDFVPVRLTLGSVVWLNAGVLALSWLVLMLPAIIISRISPATTMRYE